MERFTSGMVAPAGRYSRTDERNPLLETFSRTVNPGCLRFDTDSQPHTVKFGQASAWLNTGGLGAGRAKAAMWKSRVRSISCRSCPARKVALSKAWRV